MANEPKQPEEVDEISAEELESVSGGAIYMKLGDIKGQVSRTRQKDLLTLVSVDGSSKDSG